MIYFTVCDIEVEEQDEKQPFVILEVHANKGESVRI